MLPSSQCATLGGQGNWHDCQGPWRWQASFENLMLVHPLLVQEIKYLFQQWMKNKREEALCSNLDWQRLMLARSNLPRRISPVLVERARAPGEHREAAGHSTELQSLAKIFVEAEHRLVVFFLGGQNFFNGDQCPH